jgi:predicted nucleotide-binding protein with TIR-like domain
MSRPKTRTVFVVHGRDLKLRDNIYAFLRSIGLEPLPFSVAGQMTVNAAPYIGEILDSAFAGAQAIVVLFTPEDEAKLRSHYVEPEDPPHERDLTPQSRPNVIFEAGMAMGRCPDRTILVEIGTLRPFSDIAGRHAIRLSNSSERRHEFALRLRQAGCRINLSGSDWHTAGDFSLRKAVAKTRPSAAADTSKLRVKRNHEEKRRPWVTVDRYDAVYLEDDETGQEELVETLHIVNVGEESALSIQIKPLQYFGRTARLLETPAALRPGYEADLRILNLRYLLESVRDRIPKEKGKQRSVRLPLQVEYRDRNHKRWSTEHAVFFSHRITVGIVHPDEQQEWTDLSTLTESLP